MEPTDVYPLTVEEYENAEIINCSKDQKFIIIDEIAIDDENVEVE